MSNCGNNLTKHGLLTLSLAVLLSGCGLDMTSSDDATTAQSEASTTPAAETVELAGAAMKGVIQQGLVSATRLISDKDGYYAPQRQAAKPVLTANDGRYVWQLRGKADSWALVELTADSNTRMTCDVVPQCERIGAEPVAFGDTMMLDDSFTLRGAGDLRMETVNLTPLTHLAVALAERSENGLSPDALSGAYENVESWFGLAAGSLRLDPPDLTRLDELNGVSADALQVAVANAAFLALVNNNAQWNNISDVLNNVATQILETGQISLMGDGENIGLADLVSAAAVQASELQAEVDSSVISQRLVVAEYRYVQRFKTIAEVYDEDDTSVVDTPEPDTSDDNSTGDTVADNGPDNDTSEPSTPEPSPEDTVPANAALLSWTAPLTRENGDSLAMGEIAGFEVVYGNSEDSLDQSLAIGDASIEELLVDDLTQGTWYFAIRTLDTDGNRSRLSEVVYKQI